MGRKSIMLPVSCSSFSQRRPQALMHLMSGEVGHKLNFLQFCHLRSVFPFVIWGLKVNIRESVQEETVYRLCFPFDDKVFLDSCAPLLRHFYLFFTYCMFTRLLTCRSWSCGLFVEMGFLFRMNFEITCVRCLFWMNFKTSVVCTCTRKILWFVVRNPKDERRDRLPLVGNVWHTVLAVLISEGEQ